MLRSVLVAAILALPALGVFTFTGAQAGTPTPVKTTNQTCGAFTVQLRQNGFEDPADSASLLLNGKTLASVNDSMVNLDFCRDVTGDGMPEAMLTGFSGGAHCCFTHHLYSLTSPPRRILQVFSADTSTLTPQQLDGKGALELLGGDWRFAYAYGLPFAGSPALWQIYSYIGGQYVDNSRAYLGVALRDVGQPEVEMQPGQALYDYASLLLAGQPGQAQTYLSQLPPLLRTWLNNYDPDIRQELSDYGMSGWPTRAGAAPDAPRTGIGGSFSAPGRAEYLAIVAQGGTAALRLYQPQSGGVVAGPILDTRPYPTRTPFGPSFQGLNWWPAFTVRRATGRDDAVVHDARSGSVKYPVYRLSATSGTVLNDDALSVATSLIANLEALAQHVSSSYASTPRTPAQRAEVQRRIDVAASRVQPALALGNLKFDPRDLGNFTVSALEMPTDRADTAQVVAPVTFGLVAPGQDSEYVTGKRYTLTVDLKKSAGSWTVTRWGLERRVGEPYAE
ncbi:hypothetical protein [Deinococcus humi]|uniref:Lipoprotein n=1 Tax=Deinococcus humi TaxID=662880 RepID=A0A7W8JU04_9DEIO|nr:hypothetical protein [Deinococcus humi]MBB5361766.1 hypothetical protein [Deinococcus humi]GGO23788.1 hypothetical protein GCM10008949_12290 [Deinococcus humi]